MSEEEIDTKLPEIAEKIESLKVQINFRNKILEQPADDRAIFSFTDKGRTLSVEELCANLKKLIKSSRLEATKCDQKSTPSFLVNKSVKHQFVEERCNNGNTTVENVWYKGHVIDQVTGFPDWYNIQYEDDSRIYTYQLMDDYRDGSLVIAEDVSTVGTEE